MSAAPARPRKTGVRPMYRRVLVSLLTLGLVLGSTFSASPSASAAPTPPALSQTYDPNQLELENIGTQTVYEGEPRTFQVNEISGSGNQPTFELIINGNVFGISIDPTTGLISGNPTDNSDPGNINSYWIIVRATSGNYVDTEGFNLIIDGNPAPTTTTVPTTTTTTTTTPATTTTRPPATTTTTTRPPATTTTARPTTTTTTRRPATTTTTVGPTTAEVTSTTAATSTTATPAGDETTTSTTTSTSTPAASTTAASTTAAPATTTPPTSAALPTPTLVAVDDVFAVDTGAGTLTVLSNDVGDDQLRIVSVTQPEVGSVELVEGGTLSVLLPASFSGSIEFEYEVTDGTGATSVASVIVESANTLGASGEFFTEDAGPPASLGALASRIGDLYSDFVELRLSTFQLSALGLSPVLLGLLYWVLRQNHELVSVTGVEVGDFAQAWLRGADVVVPVRHDALVWTQNRTRRRNGIQETLVRLNEDQQAWIATSKIVNTGY